MKTRYKQIYEDRWSKYFQSSLGSESSQSLPNETFESISEILRKGNRILDLGCGTGDSGKVLKTSFSEIHGCDISETALKEAKDNEVTALCVDFNMGHLPYKDKSFDVVTCLEVLEHMLDPTFLLKEIYRLLLPNGLLIITTPNIRYFKNLMKLILIGRFPHTTTDNFVWGGGHVHYFTKKDLTFLLKEAGFEKIRCHINEEQFHRSWKRRIVHTLTGNNIFGEWFCGGIIAEAKKK